jgi:hypothetical protein
MIDNKNLLPIDDKVMSKIVDYKSSHGYYPTFKELRFYTKITIVNLRRSLKRLSQLNKVNLMVVHDKHNPLITE